MLGSLRIRGRKKIWHMASCQMTSIFIITLCFTANAWPNPQTFTFDPSSLPGPSQICSEGIPRMGGPIPFAPDTPLNDDHIGLWIERHTECMYGNYFNNVKHIDYDTLERRVKSPNKQSCFRKSDGTETCISHEQTGRRLSMIRDVLDVTHGIIEVVEVNERSVTVTGNASLILQIQIGSFQVGHAFKDYVVHTYEFNDDGTMGRSIIWTEDDLSFDLSEWAEQTLRGMTDYLRVDHANKDSYYQIDLGDTGVRVFIGFLVLWLIVAPIGMVWIAMRYFNRRKVNKYSKVNVDNEAEA